MAIQQPIIPNNKISEPKAQLIIKSYGLNALKKNILRIDDFEPSDDPDGFSQLLGMPVFDNIIFDAPRYEEIDEEATEMYRQQEISAGLTPTNTLIKSPIVLAGNVFVDEDTTQQDSTISNVNYYNAFRCDTVLVEVSNQRNIITTPISGSNGTIKEYISNGDYSIKIRGYVESKYPNKYPTTDVGIFNTYLSAPSSIKVRSNYLRLFNINKLVVLSYSFPPTEGRRNLQFFEIEAISDKELETGIISA